MTCQEAQKNITPYIDNQLDLKEIEKFIDHVRSCQECKEELEIYYTLFTGMRLLDEQKNVNHNFHMDLENKLHYSEEKIIQQKIRQIRNRIVFAIIIIICAIFMV